MKLIEDWKRVLLRAWSVRVAAVWVLIGTLFTVGIAFSDALQEWIGAKTAFALLTFAGVTFGIARVLKQPGADDAS